MSIMNSLMNDVFEKICTEASKLVNNNHKHTLSLQSMQYQKEQKPLLNIVQVHDNQPFINYEIL